MSQMKRLFNANQSISHETKKFRALTEEQKSVTYIENLSNELFYEIFDYLDGCEIFDAFSNLNTRFHEFLNSSSFLFKIYRFATRERTFKRYCKQVIIPNKHQIISLNLYDQVLINSFCTLCNIDLSFNRLESIIFNGIKLDQLLFLLIDFMDLPRLFSLNIRLIGGYEDLDHIYELIFNLSSLKYLKFSTVIAERIDFLSVATRDHISPIEHLNIDHECTLDELNVILSYTPYVRRLICQRLFDSYSPFSFTLANLISLSIHNCDFNFNDFEILIRRIGSKLQVLRVNNKSNDLAYLDADRWERLILQNIPDLRTLHFQFFGNLSTFHLFTSSPTRLNQFATSFWLERRWIFALEINFNQIIYSIQPYRKRWCDFHDIIPTHQDTNNSSIQFSQAIQLIVTNRYLDENNQIIMDDIKAISSWARITRLNIDCCIKSIRTFIALIDLLPNVDSLKVVPMCVRRIQCLTKTEIETFRLQVMNNNITKMNIDLITEIVQVMFFLDLFPQMKYLQINCANDIDLKILVQCIIKKTGNCPTSQLCSLCLCVGQINDEIIEKLHQIFTLQNCLHRYTIRRVCDRIYLRWK